MANPKDYYQQVANFDRGNRTKDTELFRDRGPLDLTDEGAVPENPTVDPDSVSSHLVREVLLGAIGNLQGKVQSGRFNVADAQQLEKLLELVKDWPALQKAVDDLKDWGAQQEAKAKAASNPAPVSESVRKLRLLLDKK